MFQLGGAAIVLNMGDTQLGRGEPIEDVARWSRAWSTS